MAENININYNIRYNIEGIDRSIRTTRSLLLTLNAVRLSIKYIQLVMSGPTIANVMWTAIQLTRVYTNLRRLIRRVSAEQATLMAAQNVFGNVFTGVAAGRGAGLIGGILGFAAVNPVLFGAVLGTIVVGSVASGVQQQEKQRRERFDERSRTASKAQGLEP